LVRITGEGFKAGAKVSITVCNLDETVATYASGGVSSGRIDVLITIPANAPFGPCGFTATGLGPNNQTLTLTTTVFVKVPSKTVLQLSKPTVTYGDEEVEHLLVTVSSEFAPVFALVGLKPTGTVRVEQSGATLCVFTLLSGKGSCVLSASQLGAGTYHLVAIYAGNADVNGSTSAAKTLTVVKATSKTVLQLSKPTVTYGHEQVEHLLVTVLPEFAGSTPYGIVTMRVSKSTLCEFTLSSGKASCVLSSKNLGVGTYHLAATYAGSTNFNGSTSAKVTLTVVKATSKTVLKLSDSTVTYGHEQVEHLLVTVLPEFAGTTAYGIVTIRVSETTICQFTLSSGKGSCALSSKSLGVGTYHLAATYTGNGVESSTSAKVTLTVVKATFKTVLKLSDSTVTYGDEGVEHLSVTVSPQNSHTTPSGSVTIKESATTLCAFALSSGKGSCVLTARSLGTGTYSLVATYAGSGGVYGSTSASETLTVIKATSKTVLRLSDSQVTYGDEGVEHLSVTVSPEFAGTTAYGSVTIKESTTTLCGFVLSSGKGSCVLTARSLGAGTYHLVATYAGNADVNGSTSAKVTLTVVKATSKTVLKLSNSKVFYGNEEVEHLSVTVSPEYAGTTAYGSVTIKESTTTLCGFVLSSGKGSCVLTANEFVPGTYSLVATYAGSGGVNGSTSAKETLIVTD
jgi:uncharacterized membrane protein YecN with MAPEG domain